MAGSWIPLLRGQEEMDLSGELLPWGCRTRDEELGWLPGASGLNSSEFQPWLSLLCTCTQDHGSVHTQPRLRNPLNTESLGMLNFPMDQSHSRGSSSAGSELCWVRSTPNTKTSHQEVMRILKNQQKENPALSLPKGS